MAVAVVGGVDGRVAEELVRRHAVAEGLRGAERRREGGEVEARAPLALMDDIIILVPSCTII